MPAGSYKTHNTSLGPGLPRCFLWHAGGRARCGNSGHRGTSNEQRVSALGDGGPRYNCGWPCLCGLSIKIA